MLNLDMAKSHDRMDRVFIYAILEVFGFDKLWVDRISWCISKLQFSVLLNSCPCCFFLSSYDLKEGNPISHFLFNIIADCCQFYCYKCIDCNK